MGFNHLLNTNKIKSLLFSFHCDKKNYVFEISNIMPKIMTVSLTISKQHASTAATFALVHWPSEHEKLLCRKKNLHVLGNQMELLMNLF